MFEATVIQFSEEAGVSLVSKILGTDLSLKNHRDMNLKGSAMRHPRDAFCKSLFRKYVVNLLGKGHILDLFGAFIVCSGRHFGKVSVGVVHYTTDLC